MEYTIKDKEKITERNIFFSEQVSQKSINAIIEKIINFNRIDEEEEILAKLNNIKYNRQPINIYIDSYGGSVYQILGLISIIEKSKTPIYTYVTGCAMSAGFILLISGHKRFAYKYSTALYHQASGGYIGKIEDMKIGVKEIDRLNELLKRITLNKTKISQSKLEKMIKEKIDWFIPADELVDLGIVDEIL